MRPWLGIVISVLSAPAIYGQSNLIFPQMVVGGGYETVIQITNEVESDNSVLIEIFHGWQAGASNGTPFAVQFGGGAPASSQTFALSPFQEMSATLTLPGNTIQNGWVGIRSTAPGGKISASLIFRQREGGRVVDSVGVASAQRYRHGTIQIDEREEGSYTGMAFVNPESTPVTVVLDLFQAAGGVASFSQILQPNQHFARLITEIFPGFGKQQGTLVISSSSGSSIPILTLRLDGIQLTSIPVRPLGFAFQYEIHTPGNSPVEKGLWMFDFADFDLTGSGQKDGDPPAKIFGVRGNWLGKSFQFTRRITLSDGAFGMMVFNGTSAGQETTDNRKITGKVTTMGADGQVLSVNDFSAFHLYGAPPVN